MIDVAVVGLGKMGLSHLSIFRAHPQVNIVGVCDSAGYLLDVLAKYTGVKTFKNFARMLDEVAPDAVVIATPTHLHSTMIREAFARSIHVFCEKPLALDPDESAELARIGKEQGLITQVGYHNRFAATFQEVRRLLQNGVIGRINSTLAEAYGPVVLKHAGRTWRSEKSAGGGCLYDYAAHPLNLLTWYLGCPLSVSGSKLTQIFSTNIEDAVATTLHYSSGTAQLIANWSDESQRKMTTKITLWGQHGKIYVDRQEVHVYLRDTAPALHDYQPGWNVRYTTELSTAPWFYLRGEEYSAQVDAFVQQLRGKEVQQTNDFTSASITDAIIGKIIEDATLAESGQIALRDAARPPDPIQADKQRARRGLFRGRR